MVKSLRQKYEFRLIDSSSQIVQVYMSVKRKELQFYDFEKFFFLLFLFLFCKYHARAVASSLFPGASRDPLGLRNDEDLSEISERELKFVTEITLSKRCTDFERMHTIKLKLRFSGSGFLFISSRADVTRSITAERNALALRTKLS